MDSALSDPPYGLSRITARDIEACRRVWLGGGRYSHGANGFLGESWDSFVPGPEVWREVLRVLKPGASVLAFGGTRTYDLLTLSIRLAGFEIRDSIGVPGLGWIHGQGMPKGREVGKAVDALDAHDARHDRALQFTAWMRSTGITAATVATLTSSSMASHYLTAKEQPEIPTATMFDLLRPALPDVPAEIEALVRSRTVESENTKLREVTGTRTAKDAVLGDLYRPGTGHYLKKEIEVTVAFSEEAKRWEGYSTDLTPSWEPICWATKPTKHGTGANARLHGISGLNTAACRVNGRHPANLALVHALQCSDTACVPGCPVREIDQQSENPKACRFFYAAKAATKERAGSLHPTLKPVALTSYLAKLLRPPKRSEARRLLVPFCGAGSEMMGALRAGWEEVYGFDNDPASLAEAERRIASDSLFNTVERR